ncbi:MAG: hypothetical protein ABWW66_03160 [Archaeoglobaceae archaeon]
MSYRDITLAALMTISAAALVYRWLSLYDRVDAYVIFFATLLMASTAALLLSIEFRMQNIKEEFQSVKRTIAVVSEEIESRVERAVDAKLRQVEEKIESIERRIYR